MRIPQLFSQKKPVFSLEIFPPKRQTDLDKIYDTIEDLLVCQPDFISVTYGAAGNLADRSTVDIAAKIKKDYGVEPLAHLTCVNSTKEDVLTMIDLLNHHDISNVLALRGDIVPEKQVLREFSHANELAIMVQKHSDLSLVGACYPEGHYESKNLTEDIQNLKYKIGAGVGLLISQLFFDNQKFYDFLVRARNAGITVPISAGIMPIVSPRQIEKTLALSGASLPHAFTKLLGRYESDPEGLRTAGIAYAVDQIQDLLDHGVDGIHLYTMNNPDVTKDIYSRIKGLLP